MDPDRILPVTDHPLAASHSSSRIRTYLSAQAKRASGGRRWEARFHSESCGVSPNRLAVRAMRSQVETRTGRSAKLRVDHFVGALS